MVSTISETPAAGATGKPDGGERGGIEVDGRRLGADDQAALQLDPGLPGAVGNVRAEGEDYGRRLAGRDDRAGGEPNGPARRPPGPPVRPSVPLRVRARPPVLWT